MRTLTKEGRSAIVRDVLAHAFADRIDAFLTLEKSLVEELVERVYPQHIRDKMRELREFAKAKGDAVFSTRCRLMVNVAGMKIPVGYTKPNRDRLGTEVYVEDIVEWCLPKTSHEKRSIDALSLTNYAYDDRVFATIETGDELGERVSEYYSKREAIYEEVNRQRGSVMGVLAHIKNENQLAKSWPEIVPIAEKHLTKPLVRQLPAIPTPDLNAMLKLPPMKEAA